MDIITLSNFRYRIETSSTNKHFRMLLLDLMRIFGSTMDAIRNSKIFRLSSTFLSLLNSWGNWVLTLIITFKLWMMCGCVRVIKLVCVWQMEFAPNDTTQRMPSYWPQWNRLSRIYFLHLCNATCGLSTMLSRLKQTVAKCRFYHMALLTRTRALVWKSGFEHLLFTLVFNLKFNLLKQLKAHTSWPNTLSHTFTRTRRYPHIHAWNLYCENVYFSHIQRTRQFIPRNHRKQPAKGYEMKMTTTAITAAKKLRRVEWIDCIRLVAGDGFRVLAQRIQPQNKLKARSDSIILRVYLKQTYFGHSLFAFFSLRFGTRDERICALSFTHSHELTSVRCFNNVFQ